MRTAETAVMAALLVVLQYSLSFLPNIELVSLLILLYTVRFPFPQTIFAIYIFVFLEGIIFAFHIWWISYLYIWTVLAFLGLLFKKQKSVLMRAVLSAGFGFCFGGMTAIPYFFIGGAEAAFSHWVGGIPFDLVHGVGNFILCLVLWKPLYKVLTRLTERKKDFPYI